MKLQHLFELLLYFTRFFVQILPVIPIWLNIFFCRTSSSSSSRSANNSQTILNRQGFSNVTPNNQQLSDQVKDQLARNELIFQAQLLEKDKELHAKEKEIQSIDHEVNALKRQLREIDDGNNDMM